MRHFCHLKKKTWILPAFLLRVLIHIQLRKTINIKAHLKRYQATHRSTRAILLLQFSIPQKQNTTGAQINKDGDGGRARFSWQHSRKDPAAPKTEKWRENNTDIVITPSPMIDSSVFKCFLLNEVSLSLMYRVIVNDWVLMPKCYLATPSNDLRWLGSKCNKTISLVLHLHFLLK